MKQNKISDDQTTSKNELPLVLASSSVNRLNLLHKIGIFPSCIDPANIDETPYNKELPRLHALRLGIEKAQHVASRHPHKFVLAADTVVSIGRRILPKADTPDTARACLEKISGRRHTVFTGIGLITPSNQLISRVIKTSILFKRLSSHEITWYISTNEWNGKAGGYSIQGSSEVFIQRINGNYSNVIGLPLYDTLSLLQGAGLNIASSAHN